MSLRTFHQLFIALSVALAGGIALWSAQLYERQPGVAHAVAVGVSVIAACGLAFYGVAFSRKSRQW